MTDTKNNIGFYTFLEDTLKEIDGDIQDMTDNKQYYLDQCDCDDEYDSDLEELSEKYNKYDEFMNILKEYLNNK